MSVIAFSVSSAHYEQYYTWPGRLCRDCWRQRERAARWRKTHTPSNTGYGPAATYTGSSEPVVSALNQSAVMLGCFGQTWRHNSDYSDRCSHPAQFQVRARDPPRTPLAYHGGPVPAPGHYDGRAGQPPRHNAGTAWYALQANVYHLRQNHHSAGNSESAQCYGWGGGECRGARRVREIGKLERDRAPLAAENVIE